jgi:hypothetical protein
MVALMMLETTHPMTVAIPPAKVATVPTEAVAIAVAGPHSILARGPDEEVKLLRQWFAGCLTVNSFISVPAMAADDTLSMEVFQVLAVQGRSITVKTYEDEVAECETLMSVSVQPYDQWQTIENQGRMQQVEVFAFEEPVQIDALKMAGGKLSDRNDWWGWTPRESDVEDCICLHSPEPLRPNAKLTDASVPVLALLDALEARGYTKREGKVVHDNTTAELVYDCRKASGRRPYFQAVLALADLLACGIVGFSSTQPNVFYQVMLATKKPVDEGQGAAGYRRQLAAIKGGPLSLALGDAVLPGPVAKRPKLEPIADDAISDVAGSFSDPEPGTEQPVAAMADQADAMPLDDREDVVGDPADEYIAPDIILGSKVIVVSGRSDDKWSYKDRLRVLCNDPVHRAAGCTKSRSIALFKAELGPRAAEFFLATWLSQSGDMPPEGHSKWTPSLADVRAYIASQQ